MTMIERIRSYWKRRQFEIEHNPDNSTSVTHASYHVSHMVYCPSVAYVKGLEEYQSPSYRMVHSNENLVHPVVNNA